MISLTNNFQMSEFSGAGEGDDLIAVVRGYTNGFSNTSTATTMETPPARISFGPSAMEQDFDDFDLFRTYPNFFETTTVLDELEQLYKPFYPMLESLSPSVSAPRAERDPEKVQEKENFTGFPPVVVAAPATAPHEVKYKRRKNQQKRVVLRVSAQDLCSDKWAWRKYGQKPIKGSPYPRSYYRCSTSKGCLARKQVERSHSDPEMFVISYANEHCHGEPARRNSLAGTTRHKFPTNKSSSAAAATTTTSNDPNYTPTPKNSSPADLSPPTPSSVTMEDELYQQETKKESTEDEEEEDKQLQMGEASEPNGLFIHDMLLKDDFLQSFDINWTD